MDRPFGYSGADETAFGRRVLRLVVSNDESCHEPGDPLCPVKAKRLPLDADATLDEAISRILSNCLAHFSANAPILRKTGDPEAVHQLRVALRRLRAFLSLLKRAVPSLDLTEITARAKVVARSLGEARDWDVFREGLEKGPRGFLTDEPAFFALLDAVELRRHHAREAARAVLAEPATKQMLRGLRRLIARRPWRESDKRTQAKASARVFAKKALDRLHRRAMKRCSGLASLPPEVRHGARIALKKARYAAEFFESLFDAKPARAYLRELSAVQDRLGEDNDRATAKRLLLEITQTDTAQDTLRAACFLRGWSGHAQHQSGSAAAQMERRLRKLKPFWR
jgi:CHAD domain-containing protein